MALQVGEETGEHCLISSQNKAFLCSLAFWEVKLQLMQTLQSCVPLSPYVVFVCQRCNVPTDRKIWAVPNWVKGNISNELVRNYSKVTSVEILLLRLFCIKRIGIGRRIFILPMLIIGFGFSSFMKLLCEELSALSHDMAHYILTFAAIKCIKVWNRKKLHVRFS